MVCGEIKQPHLAPIGAYLPYQVGTSSPVRGNATKWKGVDYIAYNRSLIDYSRENRKTPTRAEGIFWHVALKGKKLLGYRFRRQKIIGSFILDFYCSELLLGVELDGRYHNDTVAYDRQRDADIYKKGVLVVRFNNEDIEKNLGGVISELEEIIKERHKILNS